MMSKRMGVRWMWKATSLVHLRSRTRSFGCCVVSHDEAQAKRRWFLADGVCFSTTAKPSPSPSPSRPTSSLTRKYQYLSVYNYVPIPQDKIDAIHADMRRKFAEMNILGRIYLATEGINGQMVVPQDQLEDFGSSFPDIFSPQQLNLGSLLDEHRSRQLFEKLDLRKRKVLVNDGAKEEWQLDLTKSGTALQPQEWHETLGSHLETVQHTDVDHTLVLDVRNFYEHDVGRFDGATRIMVDTFKDTYEAIDKILEAKRSENKPPPSRVLMYCTGGIRCEKIGAYMQQIKGIPQVYKLQGGVVNYVRFLKQNRQVQSLFKGKNFVFDQRCIEKAPQDQPKDQINRVCQAHPDELVQPVDVDEAHVTDDILGKCYQCGTPCNQHINCRNELCHGLILQCDQCATQFMGCCSAVCQQVVLEMEPMDAIQRRQYRRQHAKNFKRPNPNASPSKILGSSEAFVRFRPLPNQNFGSAKCFSTKAFADYKTVDPLVETCLDHWSFAMDDQHLLKDLREQTITRFPRPERMITSNQASLLCFLVQMMQAQSVLELGCFTGYSALAMANGFPHASSSHEILTCDIDATSMAFARQFFAKSSRRHQIKSVVQSAQELLEELALDVQKGATKPFDLIFLDSNKKQYAAYYEAIISHRLLAPNGLLVIDNTLFHGQVTQFACLNDDDTHSSPMATAKTTSKQKLAKAVALFNDLVAQDPRTHQILLPLHDGLTFVQYSPAYRKS